MATPNLFLLGGFRFGKSARVVDSRAGQMGQGSAAGRDGILPRWESLREVLAAGMVLCLMKGDFQGGLEPASHVSSAEMAFLSAGQRATSLSAQLTDSCALSILLCSLHSSAQRPRWGKPYSLL